MTKQEEAATPDVQQPDFDNIEVMDSAPVVRKFQTPESSEKKSSP